MVKFSVIDNGIGISMEDQRKLFEPFVQVNMSTSRVHGGTGLGLSISRVLVEKMGGSIGLKSKPGSGSEFWFSLPVRLAPGDAQDGSSMRGSPDQRRFPDLEVLVAEDNSVNRLIVVRLLGGFGITPDVAVDGSEAIEAASAKPYDLILMDVQMPNVDGLEATRAIRENGRGAPHIAALTAHVLPEHHALCLEAGMDEFLVKPLEKTALRDLLAKLDSRRVISGSIETAIHVEPPAIS